MAITTYSELRTAIQRWLDNDNPNLVAAIPDFIVLAESWFSRHFHTRDMELRYSTPLVPDPEPAPEDRGVYDLPADWGGHRTVERVDENLESLYWQKIPALTDLAPTNWLLTKYPDLYLYASLANAEPWLKNDPRVQLWANAAQAAKDEIEAHDVHDRYSGGPLRSRIESDNFWSRYESSRNGRMDYLPVYDFFDLIAAKPSIEYWHPGWFTVSEDKIRIWPRP